MIGVVANTAETGFGVVGRNLVLALDAWGLKPALWTADDGGIRDYGPAAAAALGAAHDRAAHDRATAGGRIPVVRVGNPGSLEYFPDCASERIGYAFFEWTRFTDYERACLNHLAAVFVPSTWAARVCALNGIYAKVVVAQPGVDPEVFRGDGPVPRLAPKADFGLRRVTDFLTVGKAEPRKGQDAVLRAFDAAFAPADPVRLWMACENNLVLNGYDGPALTRKLRDQVRASRMGAAGKVHCLDYLPTQQRLADRMAFADCGVFLSRAEGWNLPLTEMLATGKPCVATDAAAQGDYVRPAGCHVVPCPGLEPYNDPLFRDGVAGAWAAVGPAQIEAAAAHLRAIHVSCGNGSLLPNAPGHHYFAKRTWRRTAEAFARYLGLPLTGPAP